MDDAKLNEGVSELFFNNVDNHVELEAFKQFDVPTSWWDRASSAIDEGFTQQIKRNIDWLGQYASKVTPTMGQAEIGDIGGLKPYKTIDLTAIAEEEEAKRGAPIISSPEELNKKFNTDAFRFPMDEALAPAYLENKKAREENEFIISTTSYKYGELGFGLIQGLASVVEPINLMTSVAFGGVTKGASLLKAAAAIVTENLVSSVATEKIREQTSGAEFDMKNIGIGVGVGSLLGLGIHKLVGDKPVLENKDALVVGKALQGVEAKPLQDLAEVSIHGTDELVGKVNKTINDIAETDVNATTKEIVEAHLPKVKPEAIDTITTSLKEVQVKDGSEFVFNEKSAVLLETPEGGTAARIYSTKVEDGIKSSLIDGSNTVKAHSIAPADIFDADSVLSEMLPIASIGKAPTLLSAMKKFKEPVPIASIIKSIEEPVERAKAIKEVSDLHDGKAVIFDSDIYDFADKVSREPKYGSRLQSSDLIPPDPKAVEKVVRKDPTFFDQAGLDKALEWQNLPDITYDKKLAQANAQFEELNNIMKEKEAAGFLNKETSATLESVKEVDASFKLEEDVAKAFIFCTKG